MKLPAQANQKKNQQLKNIQISKQVQARKANKLKKQITNRKPKVIQQSCLSKETKTKNFDNSNMKLPAQANQKNNQ